MFKRHGVLLFAFYNIVTAQAGQTLGMVKHTAKSYDNGYILFAPLNTKETYLIDKCGKLIHSWTSKYSPGLVSYLLPDGSILRASSIDSGNQNGTSLTEKISWDGQITWSFLLDSVQGQHHDIEPLPNGNVLIISHEPHARDEMLALGRKSGILGKGQFLSERIVELQPVGTNSANIVWVWRPFDHLIQDSSSTLPSYGTVSQHPELIDINFPNVSAGEWLHSNGVKYNTALDQIVLCSRFNGEIWIIDHSTTTAQAASHKGGRYGKGGDLLYRWGNPAAYKRGKTADQKFFSQHDAAWVPQHYPHAGDIMVFNNGVGRGGIQHSSADRITTPVDGTGNYSIGDTLPYLPVTQAWTYVDTIPGEVMFSVAVGGAQMLKNGNVLVSNSFNDELIEIDSIGNQVWKYVSPVSASGIQAQGEIPGTNPFFKGIFYPADYPAFAGRILTPGSPIESGPVTYTCVPNDSVTSVNAVTTPIENPVFVYPNPASDHITTSGTGNGQTLVMYNTIGERVAEAVNADKLSTTALPNGVYTLIVKSNGRSIPKIVNIIK